VELLGLSLPVVGSRPLLGDLHIVQIALLPIYVLFEDESDLEVQEQFLHVAHHVLEDVHVLVGVGVPEQFELLGQVVLERVFLGVGDLGVEFLLGLEEVVSEAVDLVQDFRCPFEEELFTQLGLGGHHSLEVFKHAFQGDLLFFLGRELFVVQKFGE